MQGCKQPIKKRIPQRSEVIVQIRPESNCKNEKKDRKKKKRKKNTVVPCPQGLNIS